MTPNRRTVLETTDSTLLRSEAEQGYHFCQFNQDFIIGPEDTVQWAECRCPSKMEFEGIEACVNYPDW